MRRFVPLSLVLCGLLASPAEAIGPDKWLHVGVSVMMAASASTALHKTTTLPRSARMAGAFCTSMAVGLAKELRDRRMDGGDLAADAVGSLAGVLVSEYVSRRVWARMDGDSILVGIKGEF